MLINSLMTAYFKINCLVISQCKYSHVYQFILAVTIFLVTLAAIRKIKSKKIRAPKNRWKGSKRYVIIRWTPFYYWYCLPWNIFCDPLWLASPVTPGKVKTNSFQLISKQMEQRVFSRETFDVKVKRLHGGQK